MEYIDSRAKERIIEEYSPQRYIHVKNVIRVAMELADIYRADKDKVYCAALLHDIAKDKSLDELRAIVKFNNIDIDQEYFTNNILHGPCAQAIAHRTYGINDEEIQNAIYYHTFGRENMSMIEKIVFIADAAEASRTYTGVEKIRELMRLNIDKAIELSLEGTIKHVISKDEILYPLTCAALEYLRREKING